MMSANELFYGDREPVFVVDTAAYPVRRGRVPAYADPADKYYTSRPESADYYRGSSRGRYSDYYYGGEARRADYGAYSTGDRYTAPDYYRRTSPSRYSDTDVYSDSYTTPGAYYPSAVHAATRNPYDTEATYYDSKPNEYYDYRKPSTVMLKVPICCESCAEEARNALFELRGVRSVYCDVRKEMVTVTGTAAPADVLQVVRKLHKKSRFWGDDDY